MYILDSISPPDLGFSNFPAYRPAQIEMTDYCLYGPEHSIADQSRRFTCCGAPPGCGKSLLAHTIGKLSGAKYAVLTATRALEDQQVEELVDGTEIVNVRGRSNYKCIDWRPGRRELNCEEGADEGDCPRSGKPGCTYFDRVQEARRARGIVTNYAYWIAARMANPRALELPSDRIGLLICDEAHLAADALARALSTWVSNEDLHRYAPKVRELIRAAKGKESGRVSRSWVEALDQVAIGLRVKMAKIEAEEGGVEKANHREDYRRTGKTLSGVERIVIHGLDNNWLWRQTKMGITFDCIWPGRYAERYLWSGVQKIVMLSATLVPKALQLLRVPATDYYFKEWPRQFPARLSPVWWVPNGRLRHKSDQAELDKCVEIGDRIFDVWQEYKGLVHSQSYKRAEWLQSRCSFGRYMYLNRAGAGDASTNLERFKVADPPAVLVSPSYTTGTDLPNDDCRWIWIPKLPFADRSDPIMQARIEDDEDYYKYETAQVFQQACGRATRNERDWSTVIVTDDHVGNFRNYARRYFSRWFKVDKWEGSGVPTPPRL